MSIRRDTLYNLAGQAIPLAITLLTLPSFLAMIGEERYGVMVIAWVLLGYFGLFDFGMSRAAAQRVAQLRTSSPDERSSVVWTTLVVTLVLGLIGGLALWTVGAFLFGVVPGTADAIRAEVNEATPWMAMALPMTLATGVLLGALEGREEFLWPNMVRVLVSSMALVLPWSVASAGLCGLDWLIPATLIPRVLGIAISFGLCYRRLPLTARVSFDPTSLRQLAHYGGWVTVTAVVGPLLASADRLVIGSALGAAAVAAYSIPQGLVSRGVVLSASLAGAMFPRFAAAAPAERQALMSLALRVLTLILTPVVMVTIWLAAPFFHYWLVPELARQSAPVAEVLLLGLWCNSIACLPHALLQGEGNPRAVALTHLAELLPYGLLLWMLLATWGILGAAVAWTARAAVDALVLLVLGGAAVIDLRWLAGPLLLVLSSTLLVSGLTPTSGVRWIGMGTLVGCVLVWAIREVPRPWRTLRLLRQVAAESNLAATAKAPERCAPLR